MIYDDLLQTVVALAEKADSREVAANEDFGLELDGKIIYDSCKATSPEGPIEINLTRDYARPPFEWLAEITLDGKPFRHFLLTSEQTVIETYGKQVLPVSEQDAKWLLAVLNSADV
ncbi:MAG TPA: hypothetical protein VNA68_02990 [Candidatus Dormibacteraeota bacterium]|nr:hypothetical protein [Candidatus Dormibacteraeota bacterium]